MPGESRLITDPITGIAKWVYDPRFDMEPRIFGNRTCSRCGKEWLETHFYYNGEERVDPCAACRNEILLEEIAYAEAHKPPTPRRSDIIVICDTCNEPLPARHFTIDGFTCATCRTKSIKHKSYVKSLTRRFGINGDDYLAMLARQNYQCAICQINFSAIKQRPHVDHDHITGKVRSILCPRCNLMLGIVNDNAEILKNAIVYLERSK